MQIGHNYCLDRAFLAMRDPATVVSHTEINKRKKDDVAEARKDKNRYKYKIECVEKCLDRKSKHNLAMGKTLTAFNQLDDGSHFIDAQACFNGKIGSFIPKNKTGMKFPDGKWPVSQTTDVDDLASIPDSLCGKFVCAAPTQLKKPAERVQPN